MAHGDSRNREPGQRAPGATSTEQRQQRAAAIRALLASPLLDGTSDREAFAAVVRERVWLVDWFDRTLGWPLHVAVRGGWARLYKRKQELDATRPVRRVRGARLPFDRRRYQLLCLICAELTSRSVTTIGILASAVASAAASDPELAPFDSARAGERSAFVDALKLLETWSVVALSGGDAEAFLSTEAGNALIDVDSDRLHRLLAGARGPSAVSTDGLASVELIAAMAHEPRYGGDDDRAEDDRLRSTWLRHRLSRRLLDDPVVYYDDLTAAELEYLRHPSGRRWLLARLAEAGFVVEERSEGMLAIDPDSIATDERFPAPNDNAKQAALLLVERFLVARPDSRRELVELSWTELETYIEELLGQHKRWARHYQTSGGHEELARAAVDVLVRFRLVEIAGDRVRALPGLARYRADTSGLSPEGRL